MSSKTMNEDGKESTDSKPGEKNEKDDVNSEAKKTESGGKEVEVSQNNPHSKEDIPVKMKISGERQTVAICVSPVKHDKPVKPALKRSQCVKVIKVSEDKDSNKEQIVSKEEIPLKAKVSEESTKAAICKMLMKRKVRAKLRMLKCKVIAVIVQIRMLK